MAKKDNPYGYDSSRWVEREKRRTNWEGPKAMTKKGRKQDEENRKSGKYGRVRSYSEKVDDTIEELKEEAGDDYTSAKAKRARAKARQLEKTRLRGRRAMFKAEKASKQALALEEMD
jgi:hypothetical protein